MIPLFGIRISLFLVPVHEAVGLWHLGLVKAEHAKGGRETDASRCDGWYGDLPHDRPPLAPDLYLDRPTGFNIHWRRGDKRNWADRGLINRPEYQRLARHDIR